MVCAARFRFAGRTPPPLFLFCPETYDPAHQINCRMFAHVLGIPEDAATGSANGGLAGYLLKHRWFGRTEIRIQVEQGYEMGRPSLIALSMEVVGGKLAAVLIGGHAVRVAAGTIEV